MSAPNAATFAQQRGQAMVELVVMAGVLTAIFTGIWTIGKYHDVQYSTIQAARYAAWERTAHPDSFSDTRLQAQTRARVFMWNQNAYKAADGKLNGSNWTAGELNGQWADHKGTLLIERPDWVSVRTSSGPLPGGAANAVSSTIGKIGATIGAITGGEKLNQGGLYTSNVSVKLTDWANLAPSLLPEGMDHLNLTLNERSALVTDSWDASGPAQAGRRVASFTPAAAFDRISGLLRPITWALSWIEPSFNDFHPGQVCPDIVPVDRLSGGPQLPVYLDRGSCS